MPVDRKDLKTVAIIGGGFTGGAVAWQLARATTADLRIIVFEPRARLGAGLAYDTADPVHRINVPASRMSLDPAVPEDFALWLAGNGYAEADPEARQPDGSLFPRRQAFGDYVWSVIEPSVSAGRIEHRQTVVQAVERLGQRWRVVDAQGEAVEADIVVIATSHPSPTPPRVLASMLEGHPRFIADPTVAGALAPIRADDAVLVVGNGLTSADVIASLVESGHSGHITSISRRGLRSRGHAAVAQEPFGDFVGRPIRSARLLLARIRDAIRQASHFDVSWHAVLDAARGQARQIWQNLSTSERRRLVRHLRPFWDVHRFRIAPQVEAALHAAAAGGQLETLAGSVAAASYHGGRIRVAIRRPRAAEALIRDFDAVIVTTGPGHGAIIDSQPYLRRLAEAGLATLDPVRLGLWCDDDSRVLDQAGRPVPGIFVAGPLARGTFGELMGLPQVSEHAALVAAEIAALVQRRDVAQGAA
jgi:uncharacterized NAD(P)/FAD-binding protein YdhS